MENNTSNLIDPYKPLELDNGAAVKVVCINADGVDVTLPAGQSHRRNPSPSDEGGQCWYYNLSDGVWAGGDAEEYFTLRNVAEAPVAASEPASGVDATLAERGARYGSFISQSEIAQGIKSIMQSTDNWSKLDADMREALDMMANKVGRMLNGDPLYRDNWHDLVGYFKLVDDRLAAMAL